MTKIEKEKQIKSVTNNNLVVKFFIAIIPPYLICNFSFFEINGFAFKNFISAVTVDTIYCYSD